MARNPKPSAETAPTADQLTALADSVAAAEDTAIVPEPAELEITIERRWCTVQTPVLHDGDELAPGDQGFMSESEFDALQRAGAIDATARWDDGATEV